jgi:hypothetical protein
LPKLVVKDQSDKQKIWRTKMYKISNPILIDKRPYWWKYFLFGVNKYKFE